jgi:RHS repeat-associated protein
VVATKAISTNPTLNEVSTVVVDGFGRLTQTQLNSDSPSTTYTLTTYDALGRKSQVYNPTRCSPVTANCGETTWGYTTYVYDALSRICVVGQPDGAAVSQTNGCPASAPSGDVFTQYSGNCTTVTDEAGKQRKSCVDALGRMTGVWEDPSGLNYETDYQYDALNNLTNITQKGSNSGNARIRTFVYDSLSELTSAANPESGTILYAYDADGNVVTKTAPLPNQTASSTVTTTNTYDKLNRLTKKSYLDGNNSDPYTPTVQYGYDGVALSGCTVSPPGDTDAYPIGRNTSMCDGSGGTSWIHDTMGRVKQERRSIGTENVSHYVDYTHNLDGLLSVLQTPPMKQLNYTYNGAAQAIKLVDSTDNINFALSGTYAPSGELTGVTLGSATDFNGFTITNAYNDRLQPILLSAASPTATVFSECFDFHLGVAITSPSPCSFSRSAAGDNGNVYQIVNNRDGNRTQNFICDSLNRIQQAYTNGTNWGETFSPTATSPGVAPSSSGIDAWGNLTNRSGVTGKTYSEPLNCPANSNNQLTTCSMGYDAAGNMTSNGSVSYIYDAENRLVWTSGYRYIYDAHGERVEKCQAATATTACPTSGTTGTLYWRGTDSDTLAETDLGGNQQEEYIYFNGQRIARRDVSSTGTTAGLHYYFSDHLGSHGVVETLTTSGGTSCDQDIDYYPYGGVESDYCPVVPQNYKFTGKERDSESLLDYFGARFNASSVGRFMSPDPGNVNLSHFVNPQKWNKYAYTLNNPLRFFDPDGMQEMEIQFRSFIQQQSVTDPRGKIFAGDGRDRTVSQNVTSRTSITVRIETDASKRPGNPIISVTQPGKAGKSIELDANGQAVSVIEAKKGLPEVIGFRDADGNAGLKFVQDTQNPHEPWWMPTAGIRADLDVIVGQEGSWVDASGMLSATPSFELNVTDSNGLTTNIPLQTEPSGDAGFVGGLFLPIGVEVFTPLLPSPAPPPPGSGCAFANKVFCFI